MRPPNFTCILQMRPPPPKKACHVKARFVMSTHFQCSFTRDILGCCATSQLSLSNKSLSTFSPSLLYRSVSSSSSSQRRTVVFCLLVLGALILFVNTLSLQGAWFCFQFSPLPNPEKQHVQNQTNKARKKQNKWSKKSFILVTQPQCPSRAFDKHV